MDLRLWTLAYTAGVLVVHLLPTLPQIPLLLAATVPSLWPWRGRALYAAAMLGLLLTVWQAGQQLDAQWPADRHGEDLWVEGTVWGIPESGEQVLRFAFAPHDDGFPSRIRVAWYRDPAPVLAGECWRLQLRLRSPHGSHNPGGFDYEGWLFRQGIGATATVRDAQSCGAAPGLQAAWLRWRQRVVEQIAAQQPEPRARALIGALTVGDRSGFNDADWEAFRLTGTTHLVAISGFNIAIVAGAAYFLLRGLWSLWPWLCLRLPAQRAGLLGAALVAGGYALMAGFEAPVQRALLMLWLMLAALWAHRLGSPSRVLAAAWLLILLWDPLAITSPGLWLSFAAVGAIFYVSLGRLAPLPWWHSALWLQLLLAAALAPLTLLFFDGVSWAAPLVNVFAVPFFLLLTPLTLLAVVLLTVVPLAGAALLDFAVALLQQFHALLLWLAQMPSLWLPFSPQWPALITAAFGVVLLVAPRGLPLRPLGLLCLVVLAVPSGPADEDGLALSVLDVGQGLAVVVRSGQQHLLYDAGPAYAEGFDAGSSVVTPFLLDRGVWRLDRLLLSHGDNDHAGGMAAVQRRLSVTQQLGLPGSERCRAGQQWQWGDAEFEILHPDDDAWSDNDRSCVLRIRGAYTVLLPGDIEAAAEARLVQRYGAELAADVLISPHHGSKTSSTAAFLAAVRPQVVIHSAGWRNHYGHPRPEVVARYAELGARQYVTGNEGAIHIHGTRKALEVRTERKEARRFWNAPPALLLTAKGP